MTFRAALATYPYDGGTHANLGRLLAGKGDWNQAAFHLQKATELNPTDVNSRMAYAVVHLEMHRLPEAEKEAETAVKADPKSIQAKDLLMQIHTQRAKRRY